MSDLQDVLAVGMGVIFSIFVLAIMVGLDEAIWPSLLAIGGSFGLMMVAIMLLIEVFSYLGLLTAFFSDA